MENKYKLWLAREKRGKLFLYKTKPKRDCNYGIWISKNLFPDLTLEDEPIEVELRPTATYLDEMARKYANSITDNKEIRRIIVGAFKARYNS